MGDQDLTAVKTLVEQDHVFAVAPVSTGALAAAQYMNDSKVPFFGWSVYGVLVPLTVQGYLPNPLLMPWIDDLRRSLPFGAGSAR